MSKQKFLWPITAVLCALVCIFALTGCEQPNSEIKADKADGPENYEWTIKPYDDGYFAEDPSSLLDGWRLVKSEGSVLDPAFLDESSLEGIVIPWYKSQESVPSHLIIVTRRDISKPTSWIAETWDGVHYNPNNFEAPVTKIVDAEKNAFRARTKFVLLYRPI